MPYSYLRGEASGPAQRLVPKLNRRLSLSNLFEKVTCMHYVNSTLQTVTLDMMRGDEKENETVETIEKLSSTEFY